MNKETPPSTVASAATLFYAHPEAVQGKRSEIKIVVLENKALLYLTGNMGDIFRDERETNTVADKRPRHGKLTEQNLFALSRLQLKTD